MRPEFIFLDLGNVIVSFDRERAMHQMAAESGAEPAVIQAFLTGNDLQQWNGGRSTGASFTMSFRAARRPDPIPLVSRTRPVICLRCELRCCL